MKQSTWRCKLCRTWGFGGPQSWNIHYRSEHQRNSALGATTIMFGFTGPKPRRRSMLDAWAEDQ